MCCKVQVGNVLLKAKTLIDVRDALPPPLGEGSLVKQLPHVLRLQVLRHQEHVGSHGLPCFLLHLLDHPALCAAAVGGRLRHLSFKNES